MVCVRVFTGPKEAPPSRPKAPRWLRWEHDWKISSLSSGGRSLRGKILARTTFCDLMLALQGCFFWSRHLVLGFLTRLIPPCPGGVVLVTSSCCSHDPPRCDGTWKAYRVGCCCLPLAGKEPCTSAFGSIWKQVFLSSVAILLDGLVCSS